MDENEIQLKYEKKEYLFKMLYLIRTNLPLSEYIYIIMFILKYLSLILFSISLNEWNNSDNIPKKNIEKDLIHKFLSKLLINGNDLKILTKNYEDICMLGFVILIIFILLLILGFAYIKQKYFVKNMNSWVDKKIKKIDKIPLFQKYLFEILAYFFFLISFVHQYIIEYYFFGFFGLILYSFGVYEINTNLIEKNYFSYIQNYTSDNTINFVKIIIINLITIIFVFLLSSLFLLINSTKTLFIEKGIPFYSNKKSLLIKIIIYNFQPIYGLFNSFTYKVKMKIALLFLFIFFILILFDIILSFYNFSFYPSLLNYICIFIEIFILFSSFTELIIYLTESKINSQKFYYIKLCAELLNSLFFTILFYRKKEENSSIIFSKNLYNQSFKTFNQDDIYFYIKTYLKYKENPETNYILLFRLIQNHFLTCRNPDCSGKKLIPPEMSYSIFTDFDKIKRKYILNKDDTILKIINEDKKNTLYKLSIDINNQNNINLSSNNNKNTNEGIRNNNKKYTIKKKNTTEKNNSDRKSSYSKYISERKNTRNELSNDKEKHSEKRQLTNNEFQIIGEQEIINRINYLYKYKNYDDLEIYIFIHLQFLIKIKQNFRLALYFVSKYLLSDIKLSFLSEYYLYEIKKYICQSFFCLNNIGLINDPYIIEYREQNIIMRKIINYFDYLFIIKRLLIISCEKLNFYFSFRADLHNSLFLQKYTQTKIFPVISAAEETKSSIYRLKLLINKIYNKQNHIIESIEISYLICNFFKLLYGKISPDLLQKITPIFYFKKGHLENLTNEFHQYMISNPLIISLSNKDTFNINYFTNIFLEKLGYINKELINKDFHEKLFPGGKELIKEHTFLLKQFLFFYKNEYVKNKTFLKSKDGYLVSIDFICKIIPNFNNDFYLIGNISFCNDLKKNNLSVNNNKSNKFNDNNKNIINNYSFLLNSDFEIYSLSKNFYAEFELNQNILRELKINFCQFFCIDENKILEQFNREKMKLIKKYPNLNHRKPLRESNNAYTIFQNIKIENLFKLRDQKLLENYFFPAISINEQIDKNKLIKKIPEILAIIDEIGLDYEWYIRLENFKERLAFTNVMENLKNDEINNNEKYNELISEENRVSSLIDHDSNRNIYNPYQFFQITYSLKRLGSINYYIVNLEEIINTEHIEKYKLISEEDILHKNSSIKHRGTVKSISDKTNVKKTLTKNVTVKSKLSFQSLFHKKTNVSDNAMIDNLIDSDKENKTNKKNILRVEIDNKEMRRKSISKEIEKEKVNIIERKTKFYDNTEYLKKNKKNKKENRKEKNEDDENSPFITKGEINEILEKNNTRNNKFIIIIFTLIILVVLLAISKLIYALFATGNAMNVLNFAIYFERIKVDIYVQTILIIIYCVYEDSDNLIELKQIHSMVKSKLASIMNHLKLLQDQIIIILNSKKIVNIFNIIKQRLLINILEDDWTMINRNVNILEEIRRFSYNLYYFTTSTEKCNINLFYFLSEIHFNVQNITVENCNGIDKLFFYFGNNVLTNYKESFDKILEECIGSLEFLFTDYSNAFSYFIYLTFSLIFILCVIYIFKIHFDYSYYQTLFLYYYNIENEQLEFENKIYHLQKTILDFNYDNIKNFEYIKLNSQDLDYNDNFKKTYSKFYKIDNNDKNENNSIKNKNTKKKSSIPNNNKQYQDILKAFENKSMNGSLLNDSINGSSIQMLNNHNNNINPTNNNSNSIISGISNNKEKQKIYQEELIEAKIKSFRKILPNSLKTSFLLILIFAFICILILGINIYILFADADNWNNGVNLTFNILEVIPQMMGVVIYSSLSIIMNNVNLIKVSEFGIDEPKYLKNYKVNSLYYSEDIMEKYFKNLYYGKLLRDNLRINYILDNYLQVSNFFTNVNKWGILLNKAGYYCIYASLGDLLYNKEDSENSLSIYDFTKNVESKASACMNDNGKINESGAKLQIQYILEEITNKYIEFINYKESNKTLAEARESFFQSEETKTILIELQYSFNLYFNTVINLILLDFDNFNSGIEIKQKVLSISLIIFTFILFVVIMFIIIKIEKHKSLFGYFSTIPKNRSII